MNTDSQYTVWFDGDDWVAAVDGEIVGIGSTPTSAIIDAEANTLRRPLRSAPALTLVRP